jgi:5-methylcytosine-specific restriction protein A
MTLWFDNMAGRASKAFRVRIYNSKRWRATRAYVLMENPFCVHCEAKGKVTAATDVDHIQNLGTIYIMGNHEEAYNVDNLQGLCKQCHGTKTRKQ